MPVDPVLVDEVAASVAAVYREGELALIEQITRRLADGLDATDWQVRKLNEIHALRWAAQRVADKVAHDSDPVLRNGIARAYRSGNATAVADLAAAHAPPLDRRIPQATAGDRHAKAVQALADAAVIELRPLHQMILPAAERAYRAAVAGAASRKLTGTRDTRQAAQAAWAALVDKGITEFVDKSGRRWELSTYVEMATRTSVHRATVQGVADEQAARGQRFVYVPNTPRECPLCRPWEARVLVLWGEVTAPAVDTLEHAQASGLHHPNCRHAVRPWIAGHTRISPARPNPAGYDAEQRQRELERGTRRWRARELAALDPAAKQYAATRRAAWQAQLTAHIAAHQLPRKAYREQPGAGFTPPPSRRRDRADLPNA